MRVSNLHFPFKRRRATAVMAVVVATGLALTGCAGGTASSGSASGKVTGSIRVLSNWSGSEEAAFQAMVDAFTASHPGTSIKVDSVPFADTQSQITQQYASGNAPDIAVALPGIVRQLSAQGLLMNLDSLWSGWEKDGEYNASLRSMAAGSDNHTDAVFVKGNVNGLVWYRTSKLTSAGITTPPANWNAMIADFDKVKSSGAAPFSVGAKDPWVPTQWVDPILLNVAGADTFTKLQQGKIGWNNPKVVSAFTVLNKLMTDYWPQNALDTGFSDETCGWVTGPNTFAYNGAFVNGTVSTCDPSLKPGPDYSFFTMPSYSGAKTAPAQSISGDLVIGAKSTKNPALTTAFLRYLGSVPAQTIWAKRGGYIAPNMKVPATAYPTPNDKAAAALWPKNATGVAGYDLDDWIGGQIQVKYEAALDSLISDHNVGAFISAMTKIDTRSAKG